MKLEELKIGRWEIAPSPVLAPSTAGWDDHSSMTPVVFRNDEMGQKHGPQYGMFYIGIGKSTSAWGIGYAVSDDLVNWTRHKSNPLLIQSEGSGFELDAPCLVRSGEGFSLICEERAVTGGRALSVRRRLSPGMKRILRRARRALGFERPTVVNHATAKYFVRFGSSDILNWDSTEKKIIFSKGPDGAFDCRGVFSPQVYRFNGEYHLFYGGTDGFKAYTGLAKSRDIDTGWNRAATGPILSPGDGGEWDEVNSLIVSVLKLDDCYCAFYEGEDSRRRYAIGMAWSKDLLKWEKCAGNPIIPPGRHRYCEHMVCGPRVVQADDGLYLFFNAHDRDMRGSCGLSIFRRNG